MSAKNKGSWFYIYTVIVLLSISLVSALVLAVLNDVTAEKIAENEQAALNDAMSSLFPGAEFEALGYESENVTEVYRAKKDGVTVGYAINACAKGFADDIVMTVAIDAEGRISGTKVTSSAETTGFSNDQKRESYLAQYTGMDSYAPVDAISGATKSSNAAATAIKAAFQAYSAVINK